MGFNSGFKGLIKPTPLASTNNEICHDVRQSFLLSFSQVQIIILGIQSQTFRTRVLSRATDHVSQETSTVYGLKYCGVVFWKLTLLSHFISIHIATARNSYVLILEFQSSLEQCWMCGLNFPRNFHIVLLSYCGIGNVWISRVFSKVDFLMSGACMATSW